MSTLINFHSQTKRYELFFYVFVLPNEAITKVDCVGVAKKEQSVEFVAWGTLTGSRFQALLDPCLELPRPLRP